MGEKEELIKGWLYKAKHDLGMARLALDAKSGYNDSICFHCQQAAEKYLKAYLVYLDLDFAKTHSIGYLLDLIGEKQKVQDDFYGQLEKLEGYSVAVRYPDSAFEPSEEEAAEAYRIAESVKDFIFKNMPLV